MNAADTGFIIICAALVLLMQKTMLSAWSTVAVPALVRLTVTT